MKVFSGQLRSVTASMTVAEKNTYIWTGGRSLSTELPVRVLRVTMLPYIIAAARMKKSSL